MPQLRLTSYRAQRKGKLADQPPPLQPVACERRQARRIRLRRARRTQYPLIASQFALKAEPPLHPGKRRVQREQDQRELLEQIQPVVVAREMSSLVQHHMLQFRRRELRKQPLRNHNLRREKANHCRPIDLIRDTDLRISRDSLRQCDLDRLRSLPKRAHAECRSD